MSYTIRIEKPAEKFIMRQPKGEQERLLKAIRKLPHEGDIKRLQGKKSKGFDRLRVGDYRVIFRVERDQLIVCVIDAGNRGNIYRQY